MSVIKSAGIVLAFLLAGPVLTLAFGKVKLGEPWETADRSGTGIAPEISTSEAVIQAYSARAFNWRGMFGVHLWISTKDKDVDHYVVHQVVGWRRYRNLPVVVSYPDVPDRSWFGNDPEIIADIRGPDAEALIASIKQAVESYPYPDAYHIWPGPNSNTFIAHIAREVPGLELDLPTTAIGKDYLTNRNVFAPAPSGTGFQVSLGGLAGITVALREGFEVNVLGLAFGFDVLRPAIKLPGIGRVGMTSARP